MGALDGLGIGTHLQASLKEVDPAIPFAHDDQHFFWGAMDLACTRFSGRTAPAHRGGAPNCPDRVMREGYSREFVLPYEGAAAATDPDGALNESGRPPDGGRPAQRGGAEGTRTPDPHTARAADGGPWTSA